MKNRLDNLMVIYNITKLAKGKIFSVTFRKRGNGQLRKMVARLGVRKNITGRGHRFNPTAKNLIQVFDMQNRGYRFVSCDEITELKVGGVTFGKEYWTKPQPKPEKQKGNRVIADVTDFGASLM